jgi:hypothetical protein
MKTYTVYVWLRLKFKGDQKPSLMMMVTREGTGRSADCDWAKVVQAESHQDAYAQGMALIKAGDPGDPIESIPVVSKASQQAGKEKAA